MVRKLTQEEIVRIIEKIRSRYRGQSMVTGGQDWAQLFKRYDKDHDGVLKFEEVRQLFRRELRLKQEEVSDLQIRVLMEELDADCSGSLGLDEVTFLLDPKRDINEFVSHIKARWNAKESHRELVNGPAAAAVRQATHADELREAKEIFNLCDDDFSGKINREELVHCLQVLGYNPSKAEVRPLLAGLPRDGVDFEHFMQIVKAQKEVMHHMDDEAPIELAFQVFDTDGRGFLTTDEFRDIMQGYGEPLSNEELADMVARLDDDATGHFTMSDLQEKLFATDMMSELRRMREKRELESDGPPPSLGIRWSPE